MGCTMALAALPAAAQDTLLFTAGTSVTWDDNVFKQPGNGESDRISATYVGLRVDKTHAQQRFLLDATQSVYKYHRFSHLDYEPLQYRGAWQWRVSPRLSGTLSADRSQSLVNYSDFRDPTQRNLHTVENLAFAADLRLIGGWNLSGGLQRQESRDSVTFLQERAFRTSGADLGVKYIAGSGSTLALMRRSQDGSYLDRAVDPAALIDDGYKRTETEATLAWVLTGRSVLDARIAHIDYRSNHFGQRDFSGTAGRLGVRWAPGARLSLDLAASRDPTPSSDAFNLRVAQRLSAGGALELGPRNTLRASVYRGSSEYRDQVLPFAGAAREDRFSGWQFGWDWRVLRNATITASVQRQEQTSNNASFDFRGTTSTLGASLTF